MREPHQRGERGELGVPPAPDRAPRPVDAWMARGHLYRYAELSAPAQKAIAQLLALEAGTWPSRTLPGARSDWACLLPRYVAEHGLERFGMVELDMSELTAAIAASPVVAEAHTDWGAYHRWYIAATRRSLGRGAPARLRELWPVILDGRGDWVVLDGWHRLHHYYRARVPRVPAVFGIEASLEPARTAERAA